MSDVGDDILEALQDVGMSVVILRSGEVSPSSEKAVIKLNRQVTKPFTREFFREAQFAYNTAVVAGDTLRVTQTNEVFVVTNKSPKGFEDEVISYEATLYKCNVQGTLRRQSGEARDANYRLAPVFVPVRHDCYALLTEGLFGHGIEEDEELARIGLENNECYMPGGYDPRLEDRFEPVSGEYYIVQSVKKRRFQNVYALEIKEDKR